VEDALEDGYVAVIHTNSCLVFQLKSEVKSRKGQSRNSQIVPFERKKPTSVKVKFYVGIFFFLWRVVVWPTFHSMTVINTFVSS